MFCDFPKHKHLKCTIYRGVGGGGDATTDIEVSTIAGFTAAATVQAELAATSATAAAASATSAANSASAASSSASSAEASVASVASSASSASTSASEAATSASNASTSASAASTSASNASTSASNASTQASNASTSATNAAASASTATTQAGIATTQASNAATSASGASTSAATATTQASNAATSATDAATSAIASAAARDQALAAFDNFDDKYLGEKTTDPTVDNDGNALLTGALYFNTGSAVMKVYTGSAWVAAYVSGAGTLVAANNLSDVSSASTSRTNLGLGSLATQNANAVAITGGTITDISSATIVASSSTDALRITNTGTGNSLLVEDAANPDSTPFVVTNAGNVGVGTTSPSSTLSVNGTANVTGNTTLGDATTDTVTVNGYMATGGAVSSAAAMYVRNSALAGTNQYGVRIGVTGSQAGTASVRGTYTALSTEAASYTTTLVAGHQVDDVTKGAGSTITSQYGLYIANQTQGTNNYGIASFVSSGTDKWNIYASGTAQNYFAGNVGIGTASPGSLLEVSQSGGGVLTLRNSNTSQSANDVTGRIDFASSDTTSPAVQFSLETITTNAGGLYDFRIRAGANERMRIDSSGNLLFNSGYGSAATAYGCRAWVNFNGTGTVAIRASGNVSSITDNGTGDYTVNFTTAISDVNYGVNTSSAINYPYVSPTPSDQSNPIALSTTSVRVQTGYFSVSQTLRDQALVCVSIFR